MNVECSRRRDCVLIDDELWWIESFADGGDSVQLRSAETNDQQTLESAELPGVGMVLNE